MLVSIRISCIIYIVLIFIFVQGFWCVVVGDDSVTFYDQGWVLTD